VIDGGTENRAEHEKNRVEQTTHKELDVPRGSEKHTKTTTEHEKSSASATYAEARSSATGGTSSLETKDNRSAYEKSQRSSGMFNAFALFPSFTCSPDLGVLPCPPGGSLASEGG
jgi:hypothetical protein